jgi:4-hydroxy-3-methylbut-2-en-1-yl diphosphate reductase
MIIEVDNHSGFCFGVKKAVEKAEQLLSTENSLFCLGEIVHNHEEVDRLSGLGMQTIGHDNSSQLKDQKILLRTHGEPPSTYQKLKENNNTIIDATCPVVLKLQERVRKSFEKLSEEDGQLVIFGKKGHPEVIGLLGQTENRAILIHSVDELEKIDFSRPIEVYSQTTMPADAFQNISDVLRNRAKSTIEIHNTICRQVSNRVPLMKDFSSKYDVILFVSGKNSSNGKALFEICRKVNPASYFIETPADVQKKWFENAESIGICGATSTPDWLMEKVKSYVSVILNI